MDKKQVKVSVIVTIHNAQEYLEECLQSVCEQTMQDIEILCIDGGSTDRSPEILLQFKEKDNRIQIINDTNTSYGHKVNVGIDLAQGEYISVLESDDMYAPDMLEKLYQVAEKYHPDFVNADYNSVFDIGENCYKMHTKMYHDESLYNRIVEYGKHPEQLTRIMRYWTGIFRKQFLVEKQIRLNESPGASFQDMSFRFLTSALSDTAYHLDIPVYQYRVDNPGSSVYNPKKAIMTAEEYAFLKNDLIQKNVTNEQIWYQYYMWKYMDLFGNLVRFEDEGREALFQRVLVERETDRTEVERYAVREYPERVGWMMNSTEEELRVIVEEHYRNKKAFEDRFLNMYQKIGSSNVVVFGCGQRGKATYRMLSPLEERLKYYTDNSEALWNTEFQDIPILAPAEVVKREPDAVYVIANKYHAEAIEAQLVELGIGKEQMIEYLG